METTKRINGNQLSANVQQRVRLVGKLVRNDASGCIISAPDGTQVVVRPVQAWMYEPNCTVEVIGTVQPDLSVSEMISCSFGQNFDMEAYGQLLTLQVKCPMVF